MVSCGLSDQLLQLLDFFFFQIPAWDSCKKFITRSVNGFSRRDGVNIHASILVKHRFDYEEFKELVNSSDFFKVSKIFPKSVIL